MSKNITQQQQAGAIVKKQTSQTDKNIKSKMKNDSKTVPDQGKQQIKIDLELSKLPMKEFPEILMEGFKTVITDLLKEDYINAKEKRRQKRRIKLAAACIPPNKQPSMQELNLPIYAREPPLANLSSQVTQVTAISTAANLLTRTVQFKDEPQIFDSPQIISSHPSPAVDEQDKVPTYPIAKPVMVKDFEPDDKQDEVKYQKAAVQQQQTVRFITSDIKKQPGNLRQNNQDAVTTNAETPAEHKNSNYQQPLQQKSANKQKPKQTKSMPMQSSDQIKQNETQPSNSQHPLGAPLLLTLEKEEGPYQVRNMKSHVGALKTAFVDKRQQFSKEPLQQIDSSHPSQRNMLLSPKQIHIGEGVPLKIKASQDYSSRRIHAQLPAELNRRQENEITKNKILNQNTNLRAINNNKISSHGIQFQNHANNQTQQVSASTNNKEKIHKIVINTHDLIVKGKDIQKYSSKMPQVGPRQSMDAVMWTQKNSPAPFERSQFTSRKRNMKDKNNLQLQKHVATQNPWLLPQQSPQGQGGSQDTHIYRSQFQTEGQVKAVKLAVEPSTTTNSQVRKSTALPSIKTKQSQKVNSSSPIDARNNNQFNIRQFQLMANNLRVINEETKEYLGENRKTGVKDDTFYPENLRSAKNRISRLLKKKKMNDTSAPFKAFPTSIDNELMTKTAGQPAGKIKILSLSPARSAKKRYREISEHSSQSLSRVQEAQDTVRDHSYDGQHVTSVGFKYYPMDSTFLEISDDKKQSDILSLNNLDSSLPTSINIIGPDSSSLTRRTGINYKRKKHYRLSKLEHYHQPQKQAGVEISSDQVTGRSSFLKKNAYNIKHTTNAGDSLRETLTKIYFNNNQSNFFESKQNSSINVTSSQSPPKRAAQQQGHNLSAAVRTSKNYKYQNQQQLAESVIIYATPLRPTKKNKLQYLMRAQKLYHGQNGNWIAQLAGIKRKSRLVHYSSRDVLRELVSSISSALRKKPVYRRYRTQYFDKNQTSTIGHDTILTSSLQKDTIIREEGYQSKNSLSNSPKKINKHVVTHLPLFNMTQSGDQYSFGMMRDLKHSTRSIERALVTGGEVSHRDRRSKNTAPRSLSPCTNSIANTTYYHDHINNDSLYQYMGSRQLQIDLSEDDTTVIIS